MTDITSYSFCWYLERKQRENREKSWTAIEEIKSKLLDKTFEEIKKIIKNIWDHPNPNLLIDNLSKQEEYNKTITILAYVIRSSTYSVDKILSINK